MADNDFSVATPPVEPLVPFTQQDFLDLIQRILPGHYLENMLPQSFDGTPPGPGWEIFQSFGTMAARASDAVANFGTGSYILSARGGAYAEATVRFTRPDALAGAFVLETDTLVATSDGYLYRPSAPVSFGATDVGPHDVVVRAIGQGYGWNCEGIVTTADGTVIPGPISIVRSPVETPPLQEMNVQVQQLTPAVGGRDPYLDLLGLDRGIAREPGESDDDYRIRVRSLGDNVSPNAIRAALGNYLAQYLPSGAAAFYFESWQAAACWDYPAQPPTGYAAGDTTAGNYTYTTIDGRTVINPMVYDDPRNIVESNLDLYVDRQFSQGGLLVFITGITDSAQQAAISSALYSLLNKIKAAGVSVFIFML